MASTTGTTGATGATGVGRLASIDALRGMVMVLMVLDHAREFFHVAAMSQSPTDLATTTPVIFLARWVTHFCAPVFLLLAGLSAHLWQRRAGRTKGQLSFYLVTRGAWLLVLEIFVMRLAIDFSYSLRAPVLLITLWALGASMIVLAGLVHLPQRALWVLAAAGIGLHNLADGVPAATFGSMGWLWNLIHQPGVFFVAGVPVVVGYPVLPLLATMLAGYCLGPLFTEADPETRRRWLFRMGLGAVTAFLLVRAVNWYGDPAPWQGQSSPLLTALSFLNTTKYPASLSFLLMTLGPALVVLGWLEGRAWRAGQPLLVLGRAPLFFFLGHLFLLHLLLVVSNLGQYGWTPFLLLPPPSMGGPRELFPAGYGYSFGVVLLLWVAVCGLMYPLCRRVIGLQSRP